MFQVNRATGVDDPGVSLGIDDQAGGIAEDHHGVGITQERLRVLERATGGMTERSVLGAVTKQFSVRNKRCPRSVDHDLMISGSLPRCRDR
jgi:hypothetical protein